MRKLLPLVVVSILVLSGLGAVAIPSERNTTSQALQPDLEFTIEADVGYTLTVTNIGIEHYEGQITCNINTDASFFMIRGSSLEIAVPPEDIEPGESIMAKSGLILGFGSATISVEVGYEISPGEPINYEATTTGFLLLFKMVGVTPIVIP